MIAKPLRVIAIGFLGQQAQRTKFIAERHARDAQAFGGLRLVAIEVPHGFFEDRAIRRRDELSVEIGLSCGEQATG